MIRGVADIRNAYRDDRVAETYVDGRFREPLGALLHKRQIQTVRQVVATLRPRKVLEIAPGPARLTVDVAPFLDQPPVVMDASAQMLAQARRRLTSAGRSAVMINGDAFHLPLAGGFDLVYTFRLIRHFESGDRARLYAEIARVLRPGGVLLFDAVNADVSRALRIRAGEGEYLHYDALFRREELLQEVSASGFEVLSLVGVQHRFPILQGVQNLVSPRSKLLASCAMSAVDWTGGEPLEWIVVCRRG